MKKIAKIMAFFVITALVFSVVVSAEPTAEVEEGTAAAEEEVIEEEINSDGEVVVEEGTAEEPAEEKSSDKDAPEYMSEFSMNIENDSFTHEIKLNLSHEGLGGDEASLYIDQIIEDISSRMEEYEVKKNEAGDGIIISQKFEDVPEILEPIVLTLFMEGALPYDTKELFAVKEGWFYDTYYITYPYFDYSLLFADGTKVCEVKITTPTKPVYSNAAETEDGGKTSIFYAEGGQKNPINIMYRVYKPIPIACVAMILILLIVFIIVLTFKKKHTAVLEVVDSDEYQGEGVYGDILNDEPQETENTDVFEETENVEEETAEVEEEEITEAVEDVDSESDEDTENK